VRRGEEEEEEEEEEGVKRVKQNVKRYTTQA
jgi:hypothetical protein